jgi:hypothetical protein
MTERMEPTMRCQFCDAVSTHTNDCPWLVALQASWDAALSDWGAMRTWYDDGRVRAERVEWREVPVEEN